MLAALAALALAFLLLCLLKLGGFFRGAPYLPTNDATLERMMRAARISPGERMADLGSGDGRLVIAAALAGAEAEGYEINPLLVFLSKRAIAKRGLSERARIRRTSFWKADFRNCEVVTIFGVPSIMPKLEQKLLAELPVGARVVSHSFPFPSWEGERDENVFLYIKKAPKEAS
ncbi:MAG TPA: hypothetical protein VHF05_01470 [Candidatus Paceibacterota bacterium]|nr:hypothetical protein [Candidatus Paceibacterota bacterium]